MPQNTDSNINPDETGVAGLVPESNNFLNEPPDPPDQNDTRTVEIGQLGSEMNSEAQVVGGNTTTTTTSVTTTDNSDEHANDRHAKRKAVDVSEEVETELMELRQEIHDDENQINAVRGRLEIDENMIQKLVDRVIALEQIQGGLAKENAKLTGEITRVTGEMTRVTGEMTRVTGELIEVKKENAELASMVDFLTLKANNHDEKFRSFEHSNQDRQSWAQVADSLTKKLENVQKQQKVLVTSGKQHNRAILMNMDQNKSVQRQLNSVKKTVNESNYPSAPAPRALAKSPCVTLEPSERTLALQQEQRTDREVKKIIDKEIAPSIVVGVNFTKKDNLTLHIKNMNNETIEKLKPFGEVIDNETWHKVIIDGVKKGDLLEDGDLIDAEDLKTEIEDRNNIKLACPPHTIRTEAIRGDKTTHFSMVVAVRNEHHSKEILKKGIFLINQHCYARQWLPPKKPHTTLTKSNESNKKTDAMEVDNNEQSQSNANNDQ